MVIWVLVLFLAGGHPLAVDSYLKKADCVEQANLYKQAVCAEVVVRKPRIN